MQAETSNLTGSFQSLCFFLFAFQVSRWEWVGMSAGRQAERKWLGELG